MSHIRDRPTKAICPRCGYDLRGQVQTWEDSWPLEGTCTECGLVFRWADLLDPDRAGPRWCIEFSQKPIPGAALKTMWMAFILGGSGATFA